jgi:hypothetical protein
MSRPRLLFAFAALGLAGTMPAGAGWNYDTESEIAWVRENDHDLVARCQNNAIVVLYALPKDQLAKQLKGRERAYLIIGIDERPNQALNYFSISSNFLDNEKTRRIGFSGPSAIETVHNFRDAEDNIVVGVSTKKPSGSYTKYNTTRFPIDGAEQVIGTLLDDCGLK